MTKPPCMIDGRDCPVRYVGCRATCDKWHEWLIRHAEEKEEMDKRRRQDMEVDGFLDAHDWRVGTQERAMRRARERKGVKKV